MYKSLKTRLLIYFFIANIIILVGFSFFIYLTAQKGVMDKLDAQLETFSVDAIEHLIGDDRFSATKIAQFLRKEFRKEDLYSKIIYYDTKLKMIKHQSLSDKHMRDIFDIPLHKDSNLHDIYYFDKDTYRVTSMLISKEGNIDIFFQLASKKIVSNSYLKKLKFSLIISVPVILVLLLLIVNFLINKILYPMKEVIKSVHTISIDKLSSRVSSDNIPIEIKELVCTFNDLLENLEDAFSRVSTFSSDASHELKTPLTVIRGEIEVALKKPRDTVEYTDVLKNILDEVIEIQDTINQLFLLSKKDTSELNTNIEDVYIDELISDIVDTHSKFADKKNINIIVDKLAPLTLQTNESLLKIAIANIIKNSIIYSDSFKDIHISLKEEFGVYILKIKDNGYGISKEDLPFIFDRFYRVDKSRNRQKFGTGLGLSIVKMILDIYNFDIEVLSELEVGTTTIIKLNVNKN